MMRACLGKKDQYATRKLWVLQVRAFVRNVEGTGKQELNQSPLPFIESASQPGALGQLDMCVMQKCSPSCRDSACR